MRARSRILALAAIGASLGGTIAFFGSRSAPPSAADADGPTRDAQIPSSVASTLPVRSDNAQASTNPASARVDRPQAPAPDHVAPQPPELALQGVQLPPPLLQAERAFAAEPVDRLWASQTEARVLQEIAALAARPMFTLQVECRSTICRLQVVEPDNAPPDARATGTGLPESVAAFASSMLELVTRSGLESRGAMSVPNEFGSRVLVAYFAREAPDAAADGSTESR